MGLRELIINRLKAENTYYEEVQGSEWIKVKCMSPDHDDKHPSAGINVESGIHNCFSCGHRFMYISDSDDPEDADTIWNSRYAHLKNSIADEYQDYDSVYETMLDRAKELFLPPVGRLLDEPWRGVSAELLQEAKAYYCDTGKYKGRYVFPLYENHKVYGFDARIVDASAQMLGAKWIRNRGAPVKYLAYPLDILKSRFGTVDHVIVVEGVLDALSYIELGYPAIASFGLAPPASARIETLIRLGVEKVTIAFDNDDAGNSGADKVIPAYAEWFEIVKHPMVEGIRLAGFNDANDFLEDKRNKEIHGTPIHN